MSRNLSVVEPHPTVPRSGGYIGGGRGGAGNYRRYKPEEVSNGQSAQGPASRISLTKGFAKRAITAGRGGAGNVISKHQTEEPMFQFDEEMIKARENATPIYHIGRGGAGNLFTEVPAPRRVAGERKDSTDSSASDRSQRVIARDSIVSMFSRRSS